MFSMWTHRNWISIYCINRHYTQSCIWHMVKDKNILYMSCRKLCYTFYTGITYKNLLYIMPTWCPLDACLMGTYYPFDRDLWYCTMSIKSSPVHDCDVPKSCPHWLCCVWWKIKLWVIIYIPDGCPKVRCRWEYTSLIVNHSLPILLIWPKVNCRWEYVYPMVTHSVLTLLVWPKVDCKWEYIYLMIVHSVPTLLVWPKVDYRWEYIYPMIIHSVLTLLLWPNVDCRWEYLYLMIAHSVPNPLVWQKLIVNENIYI